MICGEEVGADQVGFAFMESDEVVCIKCTGYDEQEDEQETESNPT